MGKTEKLLVPDEHIIRVAHSHWITLLPTILVDFAISIVILGLSVAGIILSPPLTWFGLLLLILPIAHLVVRLWVWWHNQTIVTSRRIIQITGTFDQRVSDTVLGKVNDIVTQQSAWGQLLNYGDIEIISGSQSGTDVLHRIADPTGLKKDLFDTKETFGRLESLKERTVPILDTEAPTTSDIPELIAQLDQLRQKGIITGPEFEEKKKKLLDKI